MGFLTELTRDLRARLASQPADDGAVLDLVGEAPPPRDLADALTLAPPAVIAELKRASPSAGTIAGGADPTVQARAYAAGGAAAVSVLTEASHFGGSLADLGAVRREVDIPVLRKDFLVVPEQVREARAHGADSVLLITACLRDGELEEMLATSRGLGMEPLVEVHSDRDLERALATDARILGVNARDLESLEVDVEAALDRLRRVPAERIGVLESGITGRDRVRQAMDAGASGILVGEMLMRAADPAAAIRDLRGVG